MKMPEILAPAGNREMAQAAFAAGCDAIYVGAKQFGARAYSKNFEQDELIALIGEAHWRGVKVFLTVNTLLKEEEMEDALAMVRPLAAVGLDAVILQDLGLTARLRKELPHLERHASTQLSVTSLAGAEVLKAIGFTRVVLGRETSHEEAQRIIDETGLEVEIFAHGSLCVSVSGQCLLSAFSGGRSGNRGCCAQPCRKSYTLERPDGTVLGKENTYLSPRDLMTLDEATTFATMGVNALKIEGRMKKPEYVFAAVRAYRAALCGEETHADALRLMTNRPFTKGFIFHDFGVDYTFDQHQPTGEAVGNICRMKNGKLALHPTRALYSGDMLRLQGKRGAFPYTVQQTMNAGESLLFSQNDMPIGSTVYRVYTESVRNDLTAALAADEAHPKTAPLSMTVFLMPGKPLCVQAKSGDCVMQWEGAAVEQARNRSLDQETVERSFRKVGDTHFSLDSLTIHLEDGCFVPVSLLNAARRDALEALWHSLTGKALTAEKEDADTPFSDDFFNATFPKLSSSATKPSAEKPRMLLETARGPEAFTAHLSRLSRVLLKDLRLAKRWREAGVFVEWDFPQLQETEAAYQRWKEAEALGFPFDGIYARTVNELGHALHGMSRFSKSVPLALGPGFNLCNSDAFYEVWRWAEKWPISRVALSLECTSEEGVIFPLNGPALEMLAEGPAPGMLLKHCPCSLLKGCHDDSECAHCAYQKNVCLVDAFGKRSMVRHYGYTELLSPRYLNLREVQPLYERLQPAWLRVVDEGEGSNEFLEQW